MKKEYEIYTDGACIGNGRKENIGGWSFVVIKNGNLFFESVSVETNTTNNRQEITAVLSALSYCHENKGKEIISKRRSHQVRNGKEERTDAHRHPARRIHPYNRRSGNN